MRILLDTNIIIHREAGFPVNDDIGRLFRWLDDLGYKKCVHQITVDEIMKNRNPATRKAYGDRLGSYNVLPVSSKMHPDVAAASARHDVTDNDLNDTILLNEVYCGRIDALITEDRGITRKARELAVDERVFTIEGFLEKVTAENPALVHYIVPIVQKGYFGNIDLADGFFDTFREDYEGFDAWFQKKAYEMAYVSRAENRLVAFLYLKTEGPSEPYPDIEPRMQPKRRLKIGTFKVDLNGYRLGERLLKIAFDNALHQQVDEVYVTVFAKRPEQKRLIDLLKDFGFRHHGVKTTGSGEEQVFTRSLARRVSLDSPKDTYPFMSQHARKFIVPIYPEYHTSLFPDSILRTESPVDSVEHEPHRNAISKVYISRSWERNLKSGDVIVFYRTGGFYAGVVTTLGIVENVVTDIRDAEHFKSLCRKRSVFTDEELVKRWECSPSPARYPHRWKERTSYFRRLQISAGPAKQFSKSVSA